MRNKVGPGFFIYQFWGGYSIDVCMLLLSLEVSEKKRSKNKTRLLGRGPNKFRFLSEKNWGKSDCFKGKEGIYTLNQVRGFSREKLRISYEPGVCRFWELVISFYKIRLTLQFILLLGDLHIRFLHHAYLLTMNNFSIFIVFFIKKKKT